MSVDALHATDPPSAADSPNGAARPAPPEVPRSDHDLADELFEFEKQFPPPETNAILADAKWFDDHWGKPELTQYCGSYVAVLNGAVVGHGPNALQLQLDCAKALHVHPQRFILEYIPRPTLCERPCPRSTSSRRTTAKS
jgi:hypothetical protein